MNKHRRTGFGAQPGFALPTVLISSLVMFTVLLAAAAITATSRSALSDQYYNRLAKQAAESGLAMAESCLISNDYVAQWASGSRKLVPGLPDSHCSGTSTGCTVDSCYLIYGDNFRTTFTVDQPIDGGGVQVIEATGKVELLRSSSSTPWKEYSQTISTRIGADVSFSNVAFGYESNYGGFFATIGSDGKVRAAGNNFYGQLGNGSRISRSDPTEFRLPDNERPTSIHTSFVSHGRNMFVIAESGNVYGSGQNNHGQLGVAPASYVTTPAKFRLPSGKKARHVSALGHTTFVITEDNYIYAVGDCSEGILGYNYSNLSTCSSLSNPVRVSLPYPSSLNANTRPTNNLSVDSHTAVLLMEGGRVYGWGRNNHGQLAQGDYDSRGRPVQIGSYGNTGEPKAVQVETDGSSVFILDDTGRVMGAGYNYFGQLGTGSTFNNTPNLVEFQLPSSAGKAIKIATDQWMLSVLTDSGQVWSAGLNSSGQLGNVSPVVERQATPVRFQLPYGVTAVDVYSTAVGGWTNTQYMNTFVIGSNGRVYGAGDDDFGQLGYGTNNDSSLPRPMHVINGTTIRARQVQSGFGTTVVLTDKGVVYTVGNNNRGQLGDGTTTNSNIPKANRYTNIIPITRF